MKYCATLFDQRQGHFVTGVHENPHFALLLAWEKYLGFYMKENENPNVSNDDIKHGFRLVSPTDEEMLDASLVDPERIQVGPYVILKVEKDADNLYTPIGTLAKILNA